MHQKTDLLQTFGSSITGGTAKAYINRIIPVSTVDGPGARTAVFVQGCNLNCAYCHNPETIHLCNHCGDCVPGCPSGSLAQVDGKVSWNPKTCIDCDHCVDVCPHLASPKVRILSAQEVFEEIRPNIPFIRGITTSGGECALYPKFLTDLFRLARAEGMTTLMDTNGTVNLSLFPDLLEVTDGVMLDIKAWDEEVFERLTGRRPTGALPINLSHLATTGKLEEIRLVCQEEWVDIEASLRGVSETIPEHIASTRLKLIAFRTHGVEGKMKDALMPSSEQMASYAALALSLGFGEVVIG